MNPNTERGEHGHRPWTSSIPRPWRRVVTIACLLIVLGYVLAPPVVPLEKASLVGYAICHRIPDRSFHLAGQQLPLCARCTGTYLGVAVALIVLALYRRLYAGELLPRGLIALMVAFIAVMGFDGLNSYLSLFGVFPTLYEPRNWLRAAAGGLNGIALITVVLPVFNDTLWRHPRPRPPLRNVWELLPILTLTAGVIWAVQSEPAWLLYPVAIVSTLGVLTMLTLVNTMIVLLLLRREGRAETWRDAVPALLGGLVITLLELTAMGVLRYQITGTMEWPL